MNVSDYYTKLLKFKFLPITKFGKISVHTTKKEFVVKYDDSIKEFELMSFLELWFCPKIYQKRLFSLFMTNPIFADMERRFFKELVEEGQYPTLIDQLVWSEFSLENFTIEVCLLNTPYKTYNGRLTPGKIRLLYRKDEDGVFDTIAYWHQPGCNRRHTNLMFNYIAPIYDPMSFQKYLTSLGLEPRSFKLSIEHTLKKKVPENRDSV